MGGEGRKDAVRRQARVTDFRWLPGVGSCIGRKGARGWQTAKRGSDGDGDGDDGGGGGERKSRTAVSAIISGN